MAPFSTSAETTTDGIIGRNSNSFILVIKLIFFVLNIKIKFVLHLNSIISAMDLLPNQLEVNTVAVVHLAWNYMS